METIKYKVKLPPRLLITPSQFPSESAARLPSTISPLIRSSDPVECDARTSVITSNQPPLVDAALLPSITHGHNLQAIPEITAPSEILLVKIAI